MFDKAVERRAGSRSVTYTFWGPSTSDPRKPAGDNGWNFWGPIPAPINSAGDDEWRAAVDVTFEYDHEGKVYTATLYSVRAMQSDDYVVAMYNYHSDPSTKTRDQVLCDWRAAKCFNAKRFAEFCQDAMEFIEEDTGELSSLAREYAKAMAAV